MLLPAVVFMFLSLRFSGLRASRPGVVIELCSNAYLYMYNCPNMQEVNPILSNLSILFILSKAILPAGAGTPHPGAIAPPVSLNDVEGYSHVLWQLKGRGGVLRFVFGCSACREFGREWERVLRAGALKPIPQTIVIQSVTTSELGAFALEAALDSRWTLLLRDPGGRAARAFGAILCPRIACWMRGASLPISITTPTMLHKKAPASAIVTWGMEALRAGRASLPPERRRSDSARADQAPQVEAPARDRRRANAQPSAATGLAFVPQSGLTARPSGALLDLGPIDRLGAPRVERTVTLRNNSGTAITIARAALARLYRSPRRQ